MADRGIKRAAAAGERPVEHGPGTFGRETQSKVVGGRGKWRRRSCIQPFAWSEAALSVDRALRKIFLSIAASPHNDSPRNIPPWRRTNVSRRPLPPCLYCANKPNGCLARSSNSRAARRAASPSLDVDRSLTSLPRAESPTVQRPSILAERATSGVQKKQKPKTMSKAQRLRQQKVMERAEAVLDQMEIKVAKSANREKNIKARRVRIDHELPIYL